MAPLISSRRTCRGSRGHLSPWPFVCLVLLLHGALLSAADPGRPTAPYHPLAKAPRTGIGFRGDGTGVFPDSTPLIEWDEANGKNILWKASVPNRCLGGPVPVGNRLLIQSAVFLYCIGEK